VIAIALAAGAFGAIVAAGPSPLTRSSGADGEAGDVESRSSEPLPIQRRQFGRGARGALVLWRGDRLDQQPVVVFLHGWGVPIADYDKWLEHLVRAGNLVIAPRYQTSEYSPPEDVREAALAGVRAALRNVGLQPGSMVLAGHSAGGALAADLGVEAADGAIPRPSAIYAVYPGRAIIGTAGIPELPLDALPPGTRLEALAGASDVVVAQAPAQAMVASATSLPPANRRFVLVSDPAIDDHFAPTRNSKDARRVFWRRLDRLATRARR
jgi:acetyl esterase/lipase